KSVNEMWSLCAADYKSISLLSKEESFGIAIDFTLEVITKDIYPERKRFSEQDMKVIYQFVNRLMKDRIGDFINNENENRSDDSDEIDIKKLKSVIENEIKSIEIPKE